MFFNNIVISLSTFLTPDIYSFIPLIKFVLIPIILFFTGIWGVVLNYKNLIIMLMSIELMLLSANLNFIIFAVHLTDLLGQIFALFVLTVAAGESAIGLAIIVLCYRIRKTITIKFINRVKG